MGMRIEMSVFSLQSRVPSPSPCDDLKSVSHHIDCGQRVTPGQASEHENGNHSNKYAVQDEFRLDLIAYPIREHKG